MFYIHIYSICFIVAVWENEGIFFFVLSCLLSVFAHTVGRNVNAVKYESMHLIG